ncbi:MAG: AEC family transporter [Planctomycetaceae bacterium]|jgi:predicted permease|nr:AEC family transporter [Planctomycetaceae bacterium]
MFQIFGIALSAIISLFCVILAAVVLRRCARVPIETDSGLVRLTIDLFFPCLIFKRCIQTDAFADLQNLWLPPLIGFAMTAAATLIALAVCRLPARCTGLQTAKQRRTFAACAGLLNYGFLPIPLVDTFFPGDTRMSGTFFPMFLGAEVSLWTCTIFTMMGRFDSASWKHLINAPILTILAAVPLNLLGHYSADCRAVLTPVFDFLLNDRFGPVTVISKGAIPVALLMIGLTISEHLRGNSVRQRLGSLVKISMWSCAIRLVVMPVLIIGVAVLLPCTTEIKRVMIIYAAMASAVLPIALSKIYDGSPETAFDTSISNTLVSVFTSPLWIAAGLHWIG